MFDYFTINEKLTNLENDYNANIKKFKNFSPLGNIESISNLFDFKIEIKEQESNSTPTNKSIKQLLRIIHPDKINIIFGSKSDQDLTELKACSNKIIQDNMEFKPAINLLYKNISTNLFKTICKKLKLSDNDINKIIQIDLDESIDSHFDPDFLYLVEKYNKMKSHTIYNFINSKIYTLFINFQSSLTDLIGLISNRLCKLDSYELNPEEKLMGREEFGLEAWLEDKEIDIVDLAKFYPKSEFAKTLNFVFANIEILTFNANIKITKYMFLPQLNILDLVKPCTKHVYYKFKNSII